MKYAILADIHGNLEAFKAVLERIKGIDNRVFLGDAVGYGPDPNECIDLLRSQGFTCIAGNHDRACIGQLDISLFNREARESIQWTQTRLREGDIRFLDGLPDRGEIDDFEFVHGSLRDRIMEYISNTDEGAATIKLMKKDLCFVGHLHIPLCIISDAEGKIDGWQLNDGDVIDLAKFRKAVVNVGAVGQPRDMDPRASYGVYDTDLKKIHIFKVNYNMEATQKKMRKAELPDFLIERLKYGR